MLHHVQVRQGAYLPHWTQDGALYHVVFRLADSLPASIVAQYRAELEALRKAAAEQKMSPDVQSQQLRALFSERVEAALDRGLGACWLARSDIAELTANTLRHFNGKRYDLPAWCVMPNHVHAIVRPANGHSLPSILKSWKGYLAHEANRLLSRTGEFWQPEYYDHLIRSERELADTIAYVQRNPANAGLHAWPWVWPALD
jgi:REP element-mobilizing transposase RayT